MTDLEILEIAIKKAIDNGWARGKKWAERNDPVQTALLTLPYQVIIFDHEFARALWPGKGHGVVEMKAGKQVDADHWKYHLMKMVISEDPIAYLGENL